MGKGQDFERQVAKDFSIWFSNSFFGEKRTDLFWRTSGSGARATVRLKSGITTENQEGDLTGTISETAQWMKDVVIELKTGYKKMTLDDLLRKDSVLSHWIGKLNSYDSAWVLIHRNRNTTVFMNHHFFGKKIITSSTVKVVKVTFLTNPFSDVFMMRYSDFLKNTKPIVGDIK